MKSSFQKYNLLNWPWLYTRLPKEEEESKKCSKNLEVKVPPELQDRGGGDRYRRGDLIKVGEWFTYIPLIFQEFRRQQGWHSWFVEMTDCPRHRQWCSLYMPRQDCRCRLATLPYPNSLSDGVDGREPALLVRVDGQSKRIFRCISQHFPRAAFLFN